MRSWIRFQRLSRWVITNVSGFCGRSVGVAILFPSLFAKICNGRMYLGSRSMLRIFPAGKIRSIDLDPRYILPLQIFANSDGNKIATPTDLPQNPLTFVITQRDNL